MFSGTYFRLKVCTRYILQAGYILQGHKMVCTGMYILVYDLFPWFGTAFLSFLKGTSVYILTISEYILTSSWLFCGPAEPSRFACKRFMHQHTYWSKSHYRRFINCCLSAPCLPVHAWALALAGLGIQMWRVSFAWLAAIMISGLLASSTSHSRRCIARSEWEFKGLGLQVGELMMCSNWNVEDMTVLWLQNIEAILPSSEI